MNFLKNFTLSFCGAAVVGCCLKLLCPNGAMEKVFRVSISVFFLCCVATAVFSSPVDTGVWREWEQRISQGETVGSGEDYQTAFRKQVVEQFQYSMELIVRQTLEKESFYPKKIIVSVHDQENGSIEMNQVILLMDSEYRREDAKVKELLYRQIGLWPEVNYEG